MESVNSESAELSQSFTLTEGGPGAAFMKRYVWFIQNGGQVPDASRWS